MNTDQKTRITRLRSEGASYNQIAQELGISKNTVSTFCRRNGLTGDTAESAPSTVTTHTCKNCGKEIIQYPGRKEKKFCSDACRNRWWKARYEQVTAEIAMKGVRRREFGRFIKSVENLPGMINEFDEALWGSLVEKVTVYSKDRIVFTMTSGMEIEA